MSGPKQSRMPYRIVILGGYGNCGSRVARALALGIPAFTAVLVIIILMVTSIGTMTNLGRFG